MKYLSKILVSLLILSILLVACKKEGDLPSYNDSKAPVLSASKTIIAPAVSDSDNVVATLNWTDPLLATDSANKKYVIEVDSTGRNFAKAVKMTVYGSLSKAFKGTELNNILLSFGFNFNVAYGIDVRLTSSYANNNDIKVSNTIKLTATPYRVPPKVALPLSNRLYFVGDASATLNGWTNNAPLPANRELTKLDETTWGGILDLTGGGSYLLIHTQGQWGKYSIKNNPPNTADAGSFDSELPDNFQGNVNNGAGTYKMVYDFQKGRYSLTKLANSLPNDLWITGDATNDGWTNSPSDAQKCTPITNGVWEITMAFVPGKLYKFLASKGNWQPQFGAASATGGIFSGDYGGGTEPPAIPTPAVAGNYKIRVNFINNTYTVTKL
jgi:hypothetical protein